jgi:hypothetical protein
MHFLMLIVLTTGVALCQSFKAASVKPSDSQARGFQIGISATTRVQRPVDLHRSTRAADAAYYWLSIK